MCQTFNSLVISWNASKASKMWHVCHIWHYIVKNKPLILFILMRFLLSFHWLNITKIWRFYLIYSVKAFNLIFVRCICQLGSAITHIFPFRRYMKWWFGKKYGWVQAVIWHQQKSYVRMLPKVILTNVFYHYHYHYTITLHSTILHVQLSVPASCQSFWSVGHCFLCQASGLTLGFLLLSHSSSLFSIPSKTLSLSRLKMAWNWCLDVFKGVLVYLIFCKASNRTLHRYQYFHE